MIHLKIELDWLHTTRKWRTDPDGFVEVEYLRLMPDAKIWPNWMNSWIELTMAPREPAGTISDWYVLKDRQVLVEYSWTEIPHLR